MGALLARVTFQMSSGLLEDRVMNDFAFDGDPGLTATFLSIVDNLTDFYNTDDSAGNAITELMGTSVVRATDSATIDIYDIQSHLDGDGTGSPVWSDAFTPKASAGGQIPHEVALCLSFRASYGSLDEITPGGPPGPEGDIHSRARRRGRVYLGPWGTTVASVARPPSVLVDCVAAAAFRLEDTSGPGGSGNWCVWSRKSAALFPVTTAWIDDAWDTQRRRGIAPSSRTIAF